MTLPPFTNEPILELRRAEARATLREGLEWLEQRLPIRVPIWIGDERGAVEGLDSTDPGDPDRLVATAGRATAADAARAVETAQRGFRQWSARPASERAEALVRAAAWLRERRPKVAALAMRECAKPWGEADADVCEATTSSSITRAERSSSTAIPRCCRCPASATPCAGARAASSPSSRPGTSRSLSRAG